MKEKINKSARLHAINNLSYEETPFPKCGEDEVLVQVKSCGICGSDIQRVYSNGTYHFPTVIGHEFSGRVISDLKNELTGKKVVIFPLLPCFKCDNCKKQNYATCENYDYYGSRRDGGMSEYIAVKRWNIITMPDELSFDEGAMCEPISVARRAAVMLEILGGENVLISGAGPIGLAVGEWLKNFGAQNIYYIDIDNRKIRFARELGFFEYTMGTRIDCGVEGTGFGDALGKCINAVNTCGKLVLMGNPSKEVTLDAKTYQMILRKELKLCGTWNSSYNELENDWKESLKAIAEEKINAKALITHKFPLSKCNEVLK